MIGCEESHFPLLSCKVRRDVVIELHNNVYDELFVYHQSQSDLPQAAEELETLASWASNQTDNQTWPEVTESARACSYFLSSQVQKTR